MKTTQQKDDFTIDTLTEIDDTILIPQTNRFHLSAARQDLLKSEFASTPLVTATQSKSKRKQKSTTPTTSQNEGQNKLNYLDGEDLLAQFKANKGGLRKIIISEPTYDDATLWRIHDIYRTDGAVARNIETISEFTIGRKRTSVVLDTNDYFNSDEDENATLEQIQNNDIYRKYVRGVSRLNKNLKMHDYEKMFLTNLLVYGKAALLIEYDDDPLLNPSAMPIAIKPLSSLRIGRVFYYEDTWELAGIEYLDFKDVIVEPHRLIYGANKDYHISPRTLWHGYSILETVIDIAETNILNNQTNIKEINRRLWADFLILKYMGKKKSDITKFKDKWKPGMPIISNRDFEAQVIQMKSALKDLIEQQNQADKKIARNLNIPQLLAGFDDLQSQATAGGVLHAWLSSSLETRRTILRNIFEDQWINNVLKRLIILNGDTMETLKNALDQQPVHSATLENNDTSAQNQQQLDQQKMMKSLIPRKERLHPIGLVPVPPMTNPSSPLQTAPEPNPKQPPKSPIEDIQISNVPVSESEVVVNDLPFKVKYQFASFSVSTRVDLAASVIGLKNSSIIDGKIALELMDLKEYIPRMEQINTINQQVFQQMNQTATDFQNQQLENADNQNGPRGPDASNIGKGKTNLTNRSSKGSTVGSNRTARTP